MLVEDRIVKQLYQDAGENRVQKARLYVRTGRTEIKKIHYEDSGNMNITGKVRGQEVYRTHIGIRDGEIEDVTCECIDYQNRYASCKHIVATMMEFSENPKYEQIVKNKSSIEINKSLNTDSKYRIFKQVVNIFYAEKMQEI